MLLRPGLPPGDKQEHWALELKWDGIGGGLAIKPTEDAVEVLGVAEALVDQRGRIREMQDVVAE